jgi:hypothetical protein
MFEAIHGSAPRRRSNSKPIRIIRRCSNDA